MLKIFRQMIVSRSYPPRTSEARVNHTASDVILGSARAALFTARRQDGLTAFTKYEVFQHSGSA